MLRDIERRLIASIRSAEPSLGSIVALHRV